MKEAAAPAVPQQVVPIGVKHLLGRVARRAPSSLLVRPRWPLEQFGCTATLLDAAAHLQRGQQPSWPRRSSRGSRSSRARRPSSVVRRHRAAPSRTTPRRSRRASRRRRSSATSRRALGRHLISARGGSPWSSTASRSSARRRRAGSTAAAGPRGDRRRAPAAATAPRRGRRGPEDPVDAGREVHGGGALAGGGGQLRAARRGGMLPGTDGMRSLLMTRRAASRSARVALGSDVPRHDLSAHDRARAPALHASPTAWPSPARPARSRAGVVSAAELLHQCPC